jgi:glutamyl/glutaminyl-tRNA synthetase
LIKHLTEVFAPQNPTTLTGVCDDAAIIRPAENRDLFTRMKDGEFADGAKVLRLKINMSSPNMNLRDPAIYRIKRFHHIRTGDKWCIYPMYDYTHCISDALESITHSCCSLEFEDHRPLYDWVVDKLFIAGLLPARPRQIEFSRLVLNYTITSKRKLTQLVSEGLVSGWKIWLIGTFQGPDTGELHCQFGEARTTRKSALVL